jgi:hypothetical protein
VLKIVHVTYCDGCGERNVFNCSQNVSIVNLVPIDSANLVAAKCCNINEVNMIHGLSVIDTVNNIREMEDGCFCYLPFRKAMLLNS